MRAILLLVPLIAACGPEPAQLCQEKLAKLDALRKEAGAAVIRARAECEATAYEFQDAKLTASCMDTLRFTIDMAKSTDAMVGKRKQDPDILACAGYVSEQEVFGKPQERSAFADTIPRRD